MNTNKIEHFFTYLIIFHQVIYSFPQQFGHIAERCNDFTQNKLPVVSIK